MKMKRRLLTAFATAVLAAAATLTIFAASPKDEAAIRYLCRTAGGEDARLDVGIQNGYVNYWHLYIGGEAADSE